MSQSSAPTDQLCRALSHPIRRRVLVALADAATPLTARDVATEVASDESDDGRTEPSSADVESVLISLVHVHIPVLEDANLIEYDSDSRIIYACNLDDVRPLLDGNSVGQLLEPSQQ